MGTSKFRDSRGDSLCRYPTLSRTTEVLFEILVACSQFREFLSLPVGYQLRSSGHTVRPTTPLCFSVSWVTVWASVRPEVLQKFTLTYGPVRMETMSFGVDSINLK